MSEARESMLNAVRVALSGLRERPAHPGALAPRLGADPVEQFIQKAEKAVATVSRLPSLRELPEAVASLMQEQALPARVAAAPHPLLRNLAWPGSLELEYRAANAEDRAGITVAAYGVAETGSLVLTAGPATPTTLNFLPDHLMVVLPMARILAHPEQVWQALQANGGTLPRAVNFVTGPSRTADVEQKMQLGAHGPRSLQIFLIEEGGVSELM